MANKRNDSGYFWVDKALTCNGCKFLNFYKCGCRRNQEPGKVRPLSSYTNGDDYVAVLKPTDCDYQKDHKPQARVCGKETPQYMLICDSCAERERFEKARKMTLAEYYEEFPGNMLYYGEEFYDDIESLLDSIDCDYEDIPKYVYGTTMESMEIDANQMLQQAEEDSDVDDFYFDDAGAKELREFVKQWNAKYAKSYYSWNDKVVVMLPPEHQKERVND